MSEWSLQSLFELNKMPLSFAIHSEFKGTWEDAKIHGIPIVALSLNTLGPKEIGAFIAFWQMFAIYSSLLRQVDPFDQPEVHLAAEARGNGRQRGWPADGRSPEPAARSVSRCSGARAVRGCGHNHARRLDPAYDRRI